MRGKYLAIGPIIIALLIVFFVIAYYGEKNWHEYAAEHHCVVIREVSGKWIRSVGGRGDSYYMPGSTTYRCDGGLEITR